MLLVRAKTVVIGAFSILVLAIASAPANICVLKEASVSQIQGQVEFEQESLEGIPAQLWKSERRGAPKLSLVAESTVNASGLFSFSRIPSGWYRLTFPVPGFDGDDFFIHVQGKTLFRWFPNNWLRVGLALPNMGCPGTTLQATREKTVSTGSD